MSKRVRRKRWIEVASHLVALLNLVPLTHVVKTYERLVIGVPLQRA
jgi:hypothetical protein